MRLRKITAVLLGVLLALATTAVAQTTTTGRIVGTVTDQQGAIVPGATSPTRPANSDSSRFRRAPTP
jgi:hypothetical protein